MVGKCQRLLLVNVWTMLYGKVACHRYTPNFSVCVIFDIILEINDIFLIFNDSHAFTFIGVGVTMLEPWLIEHKKLKKI